MRTLYIYFNSGEILKCNAKGTNPQLQRAFYIGRSLYSRTITALTILN